MRPNIDYVNENDYLVGGFDASTCLDENVYDIFENEDEIVNEDFNVLFNAYLKIGE